MMVKIGMNTASLADFCCKDTHYFFTRAKKRLKITDQKEIFSVVRDNLSYAYFNLIYNFCFNFERSDQRQKERPDFTVQPLHEKTFTII